MSDFNVTLWGWVQGAEDSVVLKISLPFPPYCGLMFRNQFTDEATVKIKSCSYNVSDRSFDCDVDFIHPFDYEHFMCLDFSELVRHGWAKPST